MPGMACGPFLCLLLVAACQERSRPSAADSDQLNSTSEMLDSAPDELDSIDENQLAEPTNRDR